ncbi:MAG: hypothetical protein ACK5LT_01450 [Lachnospirales bacterium]
MNIGSVSRENANQYMNLFKNMTKVNKDIGKGIKFSGGTKSAYELRDILTPNYENYNARFMPTDLKFAQPNWSTIITKREPAMSEEEFEEAIRQLARDDVSDDHYGLNREAYKELCHKYMSVVAPDRKAAYQESMRMTGGKMNAACSFYDKSGNKIMNYNHQSLSYDIRSTDTEGDRARKFHSIYLDELNKLKSQQSTSSQSKTSDLHGSIIDTKV